MKEKTDRCKHLWFLGFLGFMGFSYFKSYDPLALFFFAYFSYFSLYFIYKLEKEMPDERLIENRRNAKLKSSSIPLFTVFLVGFGAGLPFVTREMVTVTCALGFALSILSYAVLFWHYEKK